MRHNSRVFALGAALAAGLAVSGCGGRGGPEIAGDVLRVNVGAEVQDLDPHLTTGVPEHRVMSALFEGLTNLDPETMQAAPGVAASWERSADGLTYTFNLREDARWSNGDPVTAGDFAYAWRRMLTPALGAEYAYLLHCIENARAFNEGEITDFGEVGVRVVDARTLEVRLEHPTPYFLTMHAHQAWYPTHRATIEAHGAMTDRGTPWTRAGNHVGNGPFRLVSWSPNVDIRAERNPHYWDADRVRLDGIYFFPIDNLQTEERSFRSGRIDWTSEVPPHRIEVYQRENPELLHIDPYLGVYYYRLNVTRPPFDDVRVRRAFSMALDREELTRNVMKAGEKPAYHYVPPGAGDYESPDPIVYDVEAARALLAEAGYPNGEGLPPVEILYNTVETHRIVAESIQRMWREALGVEVRLANQDWKVYLATMNNLDYSIARSGWIADVVDAVNFLECFLTDGGNNRTGWSSTAFDDLIQQVYAEADETRRLALMRDAEAVLLEEMPVIPIYFYTRKYLKRPEVRGYTPNPLGHIQWQDLYLDGGGA